MRKHVTLTLIVFLLTAVTAFTQDFLLKIASIPGSATQEGYQNAIKVFSYSHGLTSCAGNATRGNGANVACKTTPTPLSLMIDFDRSNIPLRAALLSGKVLPTADFYAFKTGGDGTSFAYYRIHMENVTISFFQESGTEGSGQLPAIAIGLNATKIAWQYTEQNSSGQMVPLPSTGWDYSSNTGWSYAFPVQ